MSDNLIATLTERDTDPPEQANGESVIWLSDGTATGNDGDVLVRITKDGVEKTVTLIDFSAVP